MPMRKFSLLLVALFSLTLALTASAQQDKSQRPSPPVTASNSFGDTKVVINYGSPAVKGREIWGKLVPYGKVWRTGANEATIFDVSTDVMIEGKKLAAGRYALFTIPAKDTWTIILNTNYDQHLADDYDEKLDVVRVKVTPKPLDALQEALRYDVQETSKNEGLISVRWEKLVVSLPVKVL